MIRWYSVQSLGVASWSHTEAFFPPINAEVSSGTGRVTCPKCTLCVNRLKLTLASFAYTHSANGNMTFRSLFYWVRAVNQIPGLNFWGTTVISVSEMCFCCITQWVTFHKSDIIKSFQQSCHFKRGIQLTETVFLNRSRTQNYHDNPSYLL